MSGLVNAYPGAVDFTLSASGYVPPAADVIAFDISYSSAWPGAVDFELSPSGYVSPPADGIDFSWGEGPGTEPEPDISQLYRNVRARWNSAQRRSTRPVQSGYRPSPRVDRAAALHHAAAGMRLGTLTVSGWDAVRRQDRAANTHWAAATSANVGLGATWRVVYPRDAQSADAWGAARPLDRRPTWSLWLQVFPRDSRALLPWSPAAPPPQTVRPPQYVVARRGVGLVNPPGDRLMSLLPAAAPRDWPHVQLRESLVYVPVRAGGVNFLLHDGEQPDDMVLTGRPAYIPPPADAIAVTLTHGYTPPLAPAVRTRLGVGNAGFELIVPAPYVQQRHDPSPTVVPWSTPPARAALNVIPWGPQGRYPGRDPIIELPWIEDPAAPPPQPPALRVHIVLNSVSVVRLPDRTPVAVDTVDLSSNVDSAYWTLRMTLADLAHVALLRPTIEGPAQVEVEMNGYLWTAIIEGREGSREFANSGVTVVGRSRTAVLDDPYAPQRSAAESEIRTAQQLAEAELVNTGFTLDWSGVDWLVPSGAWYYQNLTPMAVLQRIAAARGAVIQSHPSEQTLQVRSRYPASPWAWTTTQADIVMPASWVAAESARLQSRPLFDAVIVSGEQQGVLGRITRAGSSGETFAAQVVDQLITQAAVAAERGRVVLGDRGQQELVERRIPLFPAGEITAGNTGLYLPLQLVDVQEGAQAWKGLGVGVTLSARRSGAASAGLEIWQTVTLERHLSDAN